MSRLFVKRLPTGSFLMLLLYRSAALGDCRGLQHLLEPATAQLAVFRAERARQAQAEWGRLILEQSTWTAHSRIESLAVEQLRMRVPDPAEVRMVAP